MEKEFKRFENKMVHIDFISEDNNIHQSVGILEQVDKETIIISSETDYDRIPIKNIRKIYLK